MRHNLKAAAVSALAIMAALAMSIPAYAKSDDKKIKEVKFRVNSKPEAGDSIGTPEVEIDKPTSKVKITEQEFDNDDDEWEDRKSTRLNSSHTDSSRMPSSA